MILRLKTEFTLHKYYHTGRKHREDVRDERITDYVSYYDGQTHRRPNIDDPLADLERTYDHLQEQQREQHTDHRYEQITYIVEDIKITYRCCKQGFCHKHFCLRCPFLPFLALVGHWIWKKCWLFENKFTSYIFFLYNKTGLDFLMFNFKIYVWIQSVSWLASDRNYERAISKNLPWEKRCHKFHWVRPVWWMTKTVLWSVLSLFFQTWNIHWSGSKATFHHQREKTGAVPAQCREPQPRLHT